jgi:hypothetical protein
MIQFLRVLRAVIYSPLTVLQALHVHPAKYFGLIDFLVRLDEPLRVYLVGKQKPAGATTRQPQ